MTLVTRVIKWAPTSILTFKRDSIMLLHNRVDTNSKTRPRSRALCSQDCVKGGSWIEQPSISTGGRNCAVGTARSADPIKTHACIVENKVGFVHSECFSFLLCTSQNYTYNLIECKEQAENAITPGY